MSSNSSDRYFPNPYPDHSALHAVSGQSLVNAQYVKKFALETAFLCMSKEKPKSSAKYCDGSIYTGNLGVIFMCVKLLKSGLIADDQQRTQVLAYLDACVQANQEYYATNDIRQSRDVSFLCGKGGFYVMAAMALKNLGREAEAMQYAQAYAGLARVCEPLDFLRGGSDEMFVGRAGFLCGILVLKKYLHFDILPMNELFKVCDSIIQSGRNYSISTNCPCPLMYAYHDSEYLGSAHGLAGILQMLLSFPEYLAHNREAEQYIHQSVDFLLSIQKPNGNFPSSMNRENPSQPRPESKDLIHWCHGAGGVVFLLAKAYMTWRDERYLQACKRCSDLIWSRGLLRKGPGICHGIGGSGLVHLLLYRLTNDQKYLYRANKFAEFLDTVEFKTGARTPDSPFSLFEGLAGTVCFAIDLLDPSHAEYPLIPVF